MPRLARHPSSRVTCQKTRLEVDAMGQLNVSMKHVDWRNGRPRFIPGPTARALGFRTQCLKDEFGDWLGLEATLLWAQNIDAEIRAARLAKKAKTPPRRRKTAPRPPASLYTTSELFEDWQASPRFARLARRTRIGYAERGRRIAERLPEIWAKDVDAIDRGAANRAYEAALAKWGASEAASMFRTLSSAYSWGEKNGHLKESPFRRLGMVTPKGRARAATREEIATLVATAERLGRADVADVVLFGLFTGQRQEDRLTLTRAQIAGGRLTVRQGKTGRLVDVVLAPPLVARLAAAEKRQRALGVDSPRVFVDETTRRAWTGDRYRKAFARVRKEAAKACPSLADLWEMDMRSTALSAAYSRGATLAQGASLSGHSQQTAAQIQDRHYVSRNGDMADAAVATILEWWEW